MKIRPFAAFIIILLAFTVVNAATVFGTKISPLSQVVQFPTTSGPDFAISVFPSSQTVSQGQSTTYQVTVTSINGFTSGILLSVSGISSVAYSWSANPISPPPNGQAQSTLIIGTSLATPSGTYSITVVGSSGTFFRTYDISLSINAVTTQPDFTISVYPSSQVIGPGQSASYAVTLTSSSGFGSSVSLSATGLPENAISQLNPQSVIPTGNSELTITVPSSTATVATTLTYTIVVTGIGGGISHSSQTTLIVTIGGSPDFDITVAPETLVVNAGGMVASSVTVTSLYGFNSPVSLTMSGLPNGAGYSFSPATIVPTGSSTVLVTVPIAAATTSTTTSYTLVVTGFGGGKSHSTSVALYIASQETTASVRLIGTEVTQSIQDLQNDVPLIANRQTYVRVYLTIDTSVGSGLPALNNIAGVLQANRPGWQSPEEIQSLNSIRVDSSNDIGAKRMNYPGGGLDFQLPPTWITAGPLSLSVSQVYVIGQTGVTCNGCNNLTQVSFQDAPPVILGIVSVTYTLNGVQHTPTQWDVNQLFSWIRRAYPASQVLYYQLSMNMGSVTSMDCNTVNSQLSQLRSLSSNLDPRSHFYGLVSGPFMRGCSSIGGYVGSGPTGQETWLCGNRGDCYGGHELGHEFGRLHPGFCGESHDDSNYPYPGGFISGPDHAYVGFDPGDPSNGISAQVYDPSIWTDVMTYCSNEWISDYTYRGILNQLYATESSGSPGGSTGGAYAAGALQISQTANDSFLVSGTIDLANGTIRLQPFWHLPNLPLTSLPLSSPYSLSLLDNSGKTLASYPFTVYESSDDPSQTGSFYVVVPYSPGTSRVEIFRNGILLASRSADSSVPQVKVIYPTSGLPLQSGNLTVTWEGNDAGGDSLTYALLYSYDGGKTWQALATGIQATRYTVDLSKLAGSPIAQFRVAASDGFNTGFGDSGILTLSWKAPEPQIISPGNGSIFSVNQTIVLVGQAFDIQDGWLDGQALQWRSDQNVIGSGRSVSVTGLSPGDHTITLTATDSKGAQGIASITIQVSSPVHSSATSSTSETSSQIGPRCIIATAAYGSELAAPVQFLRSFRDNEVQKTILGGYFMSAFNHWYYSWAPTIAQQIAPNENYKAATRVLISPLIGTLYASHIVFATLAPASPELAVLLAGLLASALLGLIYLGPFYGLFWKLSKRRIPKRAIYTLAVVVAALTFLATLTTSTFTAGANLTALAVVETLLLTPALIIRKIVSLTKTSARPKPN